MEYGPTTMKFGAHANIWACCLPITQSFFFNLDETSYTCSGAHLLHVEHLLFYVIWYNKVLILLMW